MVSKKSLNIRSLNDYKIICIALVLVIVAMVIAWKPWVQTSGRTITVNGTASLKADPDEFVFYPSYQVSNSDKAAALKDLTDKTDQVTKQLTALGLSENQIQTQSNATDNKLSFAPDAGTDPTYYLSFTITTSSKEQAQKVSDYLVTTPLLGSISPQPSFNTETRKKLESQAREQALNDARAQADQTVHSLGAKLGSVKTVVDGAGSGDMPIPLSGSANSGVSTLAIGDGAASRSIGGAIGILPGQDTISYSVSVTYFIR